MVSEIKVDGLKGALEREKEGRKEASEEQGRAGLKRREGFQRLLV